MHSHTQKFKRLACDLCKTKDLSSVAKIGEGSYALAVPPGWRLIYSKAEGVLFWCPACWEVFALTLEEG